jgi:hypothetical protein
VAIAFAARHRAWHALAIAAALLFSPLGTLAIAAQPQRLTTDGTLKMDPVFVNDGREIVFTRLETPNQLC